MNDENSQRSLAFWITLLKNRILVSDVNDATVAALCGHLADLGVLAKVGEEGWELVPQSDESLKVEEEIEKALKQSLRNRIGFRSSLFFEKSSSFSSMSDSQDQEKGSAEVDPKSNPQLLDQKTSNLSNLQLVKKYGRQDAVVCRVGEKLHRKLLGPHTTLKQARKIFNFVLSRMKQKTEPRPWEQLSRRRHK